MPNVQRLNSAVGCMSHKAIFTYRRERFLEKTSKHGGGIINEERRAPAAGLRGGRRRTVIVSGPLNITEPTSSELDTELNERLL